MVEIAFDEEKESVGLGTTLSEVTMRRKKE